MGNVKADRCVSGSRDFYPLRGDTAVGQDETCTETEFLNSLAGRQEKENRSRVSGKAGSSGKTVAGRTFLAAGLVLFLLTGIVPSLTVEIAGRVPASYSLPQAIAAYDQMNSGSALGVQIIFWAAFALVAALGVTALIRGTKGFSILGSVLYWCFLTAASLAFMAVDEASESAGMGTGICLLVVGAVLTTFGAIFFCTRKAGAPDDTEAEAKNTPPNLILKTQRVK